jgi:hypothetical protein
MLMTAMAVFTISFGAVTPTEPSAPKKPSEVMIPVGNTGKYVSMTELSKMKVKQWETLTGKKMSLKEKIAFGAVKSKIKEQVRTYNKTGNYAPIDFKDPVDKWLWFWIFGWGLGIVFLFIPVFGWILSSLFFLFGSISLIVWLVKKFA